MASDSCVVLEGSMKFRDGKKWKPRWGVLTKLSPVADCLQLLLYRDQRERLKEGHTKASLSLQNYYGYESGFILDKECNTMALIIEEGVFVFAFDTRERLIQWQAKITSHLGEAVQFEVEVTSAPPKSKCGMALGESAPRTSCTQLSGHVTSQIGNGIPAMLHLVNIRFCLTSADSPPPKLLHRWEIANLRRYGVVDGHFCWEGGSSCGQKGMGIHVVATAQRKEIESAFKIAAAGNLIKPGKRSRSRNPGCNRSPKPGCLSHGESKHSLVSGSVLSGSIIGTSQSRRTLHCRCGTPWSSTESGSSGECSHSVSAMSRPDTPDSSMILNKNKFNPQFAQRQMSTTSVGPTTPKKMHPHLRLSKKDSFSPSWKMDGICSDDSGHVPGSDGTSSRSRDSEYCAGFSYPGNSNSCASSGMGDAAILENYDRPRKVITAVIPPGFRHNFASANGISKMSTSMSFCERCDSCGRPKMTQGPCCCQGDGFAQQGSLRNRYGLIVGSRAMMEQANQRSNPDHFKPQYDPRFYDTPRFNQPSNIIPHQRMDFYNNPHPRFVRPAVTRLVRYVGPPRPGARCPMVSAIAAESMLNGEQMYANIRPSRPAFPIPPAVRGPGMGNYANLEFAETLDLYENVKKESGLPVLPPRAHPPLHSQQGANQVESLVPERKTSIEREVVNPVGVRDDYVLMAPLVRQRPPSSQPDSELPSPAGFANCDEIVVTAETRPLPEAEVKLDVAETPEYEVTYVYACATMPRCVKSEEFQCLRRAFSMPTELWTTGVGVAAGGDESPAPLEADSSLEDSGVSGDTPSGDDRSSGEMKSDDTVEPVTKGVRVLELDEELKDSNGMERVN
ncbi:unnamed protein product [Notodromas monacha]|uniref:PH domain-containing protein n=1 Tax=Notodromas monacha TaxID=399045 RepID=A0A7R9BL41_9CRUS|nr:unnamed protein product [Notodromas monacha]CAG0916645.1 unnamed protein product [Notodromas monacha]